MSNDANDADTLNECKWVKELAEEITMVLAEKFVDSYGGA